MRTPDPSGPLRSNATAVTRCWIYRPWNPRERKFREEILPTPEENAFRHTVGRLRAEVATVKWTAARIAKLEAKLAEARV